jgi:hypothetical protein
MRRPGHPRHQCSRCPLVASHARTASTLADSALLLYKSALLRAEDMQSLPYGIALLKALVLGKFILIGKAASVGSYFRPTLLLHRILWKSEELVIGLVHGHTVASIITGFMGDPG